MTLAAVYVNMRRLIFIYIEMGNAQIPGIPSATHAFLLVPGGEVLYYSRGTISAIRMVGSILRNDDDKHINQLLP